MLKLAPVNPWIVIGVMVAILTAGAVGYWRGGVNTKSRIESDIARENQIARVAYDNALKATAEQIANIKIVNTTVRQELEREIRKEPVYLDCRHSDDVKRLLDAVLTGQAPAESFDRSKLPAADTAD